VKSMRKMSSKRARHATRRPRNGGQEFEPRALVRAARRAVREALRLHKNAGNPVAGIVNGRIVLIPPSRIKV